MKPLSRGERTQRSDESAAIARSVSNGVVGVQWRESAKQKTEYRPPRVGDDGRRKIMSTNKIIAELDAEQMGRELP